MNVGSSFLGQYSLEGEKSIRNKNPSCLILPEHKESTSLRQLPKLSVRDDGKGANNDYGLRRDSLTNLRKREEYRWLFHGAEKPSGEATDYWKMSIKPLKNYEAFPDEWLGDMKVLKMRVAQLKLDIHAVHRRPHNNNIYSRVKKPSE